MTLRIYCASKLYMAEAWREMRYQLTDISIVSSWIDIPNIQQADEDYQLLEKVWERNVADVLKSDVVLVYAAQEDTLVGGLVEVGIGLGAGKTIICVGSSRSFGTWIQHENVYKANSVLDAVKLAKALLG